MQDYITPLTWLLEGLFLIIFRKQVALFLQKLFESFPKYQKGVQLLRMRFDVRPFYIAALGVMIWLIVLLSILAQKGIHL